VRETLQYFCVLRVCSSKNVSHYSKIGVFYKYNSYRLFYSLPYFSGR